MATLAVLKSLHTMDNRQFIKGLSDSQRRSRKAGAAIGRQARNMSRRFQTLTGNVFSLRSAVGVLAGSAGIGLLVRQQMSAIDSSAKLASRLNVTTTELTALHRLTELNGESTERMDKSLEAMARRVGQAAEGFGQAERALEQLNLNAEDLNEMGMAQQFETISRELAKVENANTKASIAADLFSRQGIGLLNTMEALGKDGLAPTIERLEQTGEAFDEIDAAKVEAANDAITEMKGAFTGMARIVTIELAEPIQAIAESMDEAITGSDDFKTSVREMTRASVGGVATMLDAAASVTDFVQQNSTMVQFGLVGYVLLGKKGALIGSVIGSLIDGVQRRMAAFGVGVSENVGELIRLEDRVEGLQNRLETLPEGGREFRRVQQQLREARGELERVQEAATPEQLIEYAAAWDKNEEAASGVSSGLRALAEAMRASLEEGEKLSEMDMLAGMQGAGPARGRLRDGEPSATEITQEEMDKQKARLDVMREGMATEMELEQAHFEREQEFLATAHETLFESEAERKMMLQNLEREHQNRLFEIQAQGQGSLLSQQLSFLSQIEAAQKSSGAAQVGIMSNAFASITAAGAQHSKELFEVNKVAGIANAIVSTYQGAAEALKLGPFIGPPLAAMMIAVGMAKVNAIRSTSFSGGGGAAPSTSAGGGVPAVQDVSQQGQGQGGQQAQNVTIEIAGGDDRLLSKRQLRQLMEGMQEELGDDASIGQLRIA